MEVRATEEFTSWLGSLSDHQARARILARIDRIGVGNLGDVKPVGEGVSETRIHYGPGYRVYFFQQGETLVVLLGGGVKKTQAADIKKAISLKGELNA